MLHRVTVVTTGLLITPGETKSGYRFIPYDRARAYDALALRLNGVLNDVFKFHYPFTEDLRAPFDQADPIGLIQSPWFDAPDYDLAKDKVAKEVSDFLPFVEFARAGRARPFAYVIESIAPGQVTPRILIAPVRYPYKGNHIRGWGNEIGELVNNASDTVELFPELRTLTALAVEARDDVRMETSITRYWAVLEALARRWSTMEARDDSELPDIYWKGVKHSRDLNKALWCVWAYCHEEFYVPVHLLGPEHPLEQQLKASYYIRNKFMHGKLSVSNAVEEDRLATQFAAEPFFHHWFGLQHLVECALRYEFTR